MNRSAPYPATSMALDDFEELLADQPDGERWELIEGRVVRMMVGARWDKGATSLDDPVVVLEVLSDGCQHRDRDVKRAVCQKIPSLRLLPI